MLSPKNATFGPLTAAGVLTGGAGTGAGVVAAGVLHAQRISKLARHASMRFDELNMLVLTAKAC
jgi:hypothetical protein